MIDVLLSSVAYHPNSIVESGRLGDFRVAAEILERVMPCTRRDHNVCFVLVNQST